MKVGVAVTNLGPTQLNYFLIQNTNRLLAERHDVDLIVFYENLHNPCLTMNFGSMQLTEAWGYDGTLIATTLSTASKILQFPGPSRKLFYVWDLEWLRMREKSFSELRSIYANPRLQLIARSDEHARVLEACWNTPILGVVEDFNINNIINEAQRS